MRRSRRYFLLAVLLLMAALADRAVYLHLIGKSGGETSLAESSYQEIVKARQDVIDSLVIRKNASPQSLPSDVPVYLEGYLKNPGRQGDTVSDLELGVRLDLGGEYQAPPPNMAVQRQAFRYDGTKWRVQKEPLEEFRGFPLTLAGVEVPWSHGLTSYRPMEARLTLLDNHRLPESYSEWDRKIVTPERAYEGDALVLQHYPSSLTQGDLKFVYWEAWDQKVGALGAVESGKLVPFDPGPPLNNLFDSEVKILAMIGTIAASHLDGFQGADYTFNPEGTLKKLLKLPEKKAEAVSDFDNKFSGGLTIIFLVLAALAALRGFIFHRQEKVEAQEPAL